MFHSLTRYLEMKCTHIWWINNNLVKIHMRSFSPFILLYSVFYDLPVIAAYAKIIIESLICPRRRIVFHKRNPMPIYVLAVCVEIYDIRDEIRVQTVVEILSFVCSVEFHAEFHRRIRIYVELLNN